jgi:hypothetical protein
MTEFHTALLSTWVGLCGGQVLWILNHWKEPERVERGIHSIYCYSWFSCMLILANYLLNS